MRTKLIETVRELCSNTLVSEVTIWMLCECVWSTRCNLDIAISMDQSEASSYIFISTRATLKSYVAAVYRTHRHTYPSWVKRWGSGGACGGSMRNGRDCLIRILLSPEVKRMMMMISIPGSIPMMMICTEPQTRTVDGSGGVSLYPDLRFVGVEFRSDSSSAQLMKKCRMEKGWKIHLTPMAIERLARGHRPWKWKPIVASLVETLWFRSSCKVFFALVVPCGKCRQRRRSTNSPRAHRCSRLRIHDCHLHTPPPYRSIRHIHHNSHCQLICRFGGEGLSLNTYSRFMNVLVDGKWPTLKDW